MAGSRTPRAIAILPARGGSKRIPRKNARGFLGKPILAYSVEAALLAGVFDRVVVSTDDGEIADLAKQCGAEVPFLRSAETSTDTAGTAEVLLEVLGEYERRGESFERLCCVYPCAPFVTAKRLREGMAALELGADSAVPLVRFSSPPQRGFALRGGRAAMLRPEHYASRSQDLEPIYHDAGQFYCLKTAAFLAERRLFCGVTVPILLPGGEAQDIDTEEDWRLAELKYKLLHEREPG